MSISYPDDSEGMRNIYPVEQMLAVHRDMQKADETRQNDPGDGKYGFYNIHVIEEPKCTFADHKLKLDDCIPVLSAILPRVAEYRIVPDYGWIQEDNPIVFGLSSRLLIKIQA
ncbi:MAG: hypothetical protein AAGD34_19625, partial [Pseudomonadota bacterium]